jgi:hypothetical protein
LCIAIPRHTDAAGAPFVTFPVARRKRCDETLDTKGTMNTKNTHEEIFFKERSRKGFVFFFVCFVSFVSIVRDLPQHG